MHQMMLSDRVRMDKFEDAIKSTVRPGDVVVDLGSGTGILGMMAARAGAGQVYCIEGSEIARLSKDIIEANNLSAVVTVIEGEITETSIQNEADVVVGELLGSFGVEEDVLSVYKYANDNYLKKNGLLLPSALRLLIAPVNSSTMIERISFWDKPGSFEFSPVIDRLIHFPVVTELKEEDRIGEAVVLSEYNLGQATQQDINEIVNIDIEDDIVLNGFCGWFEADLAPGIILSNNPKQVATHWGQMIFPIHPALEMTAGDSCSIRITTSHFGKEIQFNWFVEFCISGEQVRRKHAAFLGLETPETVTDWFPQNKTSAEKENSELEKVEDRS